MKTDETVYHEYANWKLENEALLKEIKEKAENIYFRFKHVIDVIDFYYDKLIDDATYTEEDDVIFKTGFYYSADLLEDIKEILSKVYNNNVIELENHSKAINLFLNAIDFQTEVLNNEINGDKDVQRLMGFDQEVYSYISKKEEVPEKYYEELDLLSLNIFQKLNISYYSISNIYLEIADELNILD